MGSLQRLQEVKERVEKRKIDMARVMPYLQHINAGSWADIVGGHADYYKYLPMVLEEVGAKQVVELGSAAGASALMMLSHLPKGHLFAISIPEPEGEFRFIQEDYSNLTMIRGSSLDEKSYEGFDPKETDVWFWDTDHNYEQIRAEYDFCHRWLRTGALVFVDDIDLNPGMKKFWGEVEEPKLSLPNWHTYKNTGFGVFTCPKS